LGVDEIQSYLISFLILIIFFMNFHI